MRQSKLCRIKVPAVFPFQALYFHYIIVLIFLGIITKLVSHARVRKPYFRVDPLARFWRPLTVFVLFWLQLIKPAVTSLISSSSDQLSSALWFFHVNQFDAAKAVTARSDGTGSRIVRSQSRRSTNVENILCKMEPVNVDYSGSSFPQEMSRVAKSICRNHQI